MIRQLLTTTFLLFIALPAQAQITDDYVRKFIDYHKKTMGSCDPVKIEKHLRSNFAKSYSLTATDETGQRKSVTRAQMINEVKNIPQDFDLSQLNPEDCAPPFTVTDIQSNGQTAQFTTLEQTSFEIENKGKMYDVIVSLTCQNQMGMDGKRAKLLRTLCKGKQQAKAK